MLKHNKKRNTRIIYEQLVSVITRLASSGNPKEAQCILNLTCKHFRASSVLGRELKLFEAILNIQGESKENSQKILDEALGEAFHIAPEDLRAAQDSLIKDVKAILSEDVFNIPVKDYKLMASAQILLTEARTGNCSTTPAERVKMKRVLVERISTKPQEPTEKIDNFTYNLAVEKFNRKYSKLMNEDQRQILSSYLRYLVDAKTTTITSLLEEKKKKIQNILARHVNEKFEDAELQTMIKEGYKKINSLEVSTISDDIIYEMMRYLDIAEDLEQK